MGAAPQQEPGIGVAIPVEVTVHSFRNDVEKWAPELDKVAYKGFTPDRVIAAALQAALYEPDIFKATPRSLYVALMKIARWGLDIGDTVYLVPLNKKISKRGEPDKWQKIVEAWPDYKGLKALAIRQGVVRGMEEFVVYKGDQFDYQLGLDAFLRHKPNPNPAQRGDMTGAYTIIRLPFGQRSFNYMPIADIEVIRAKSKSWSPEKGFKLCPPWYAKKTVVRDYLNRQPKLGALSEALAADDTLDVDMETGEVLSGEMPAEHTEEDRAFAAALGTGDPPAEPEPAGPEAERQADLEILARDGGRQ